MEVADRQVDETKEVVCRSGYILLVVLEDAVLAFVLLERTRGICDGKEPNSSPSSELEPSSSSSEDKDPPSSIILSCVSSSERSSASRASSSSDAYMASSSSNV